MSFLSNIGFGVIVGSLLLAAIGGLIYWFFQRGRYVFTFHLWNRDMTAFKVIKGKLVTDKTNKSLKNFGFKGHSDDTKLPIKDPHYFADGKPIRAITYDSGGEYTYVTNINIDEKKYMNFRLEPIERSLALHQFKDNAIKNPLIDTLGVATVVGFVIIAIFTVLGFIYVFASQAKMADTLETIVPQIQEISSTNSRVVSGLQIATENIAYSVATLTNTTVRLSLPADGSS